MQENITAYFRQLVQEHYPSRLQELERLKESMLDLDTDIEVSQLLIEKIIAEVSTLLRAEAFLSEGLQWKQTAGASIINFPSDYIARKQKTIGDLTSHLRALLFNTHQQNATREKVLAVLAEYIQTEYKLSSLLIEKERRIFELTHGQANGIR